MPDTQDTSKKADTPKPIDRSQEFIAAYNALVKEYGLTFIVRPYFEPDKYGNFTVRLETRIDKVNQ